MSKLADDVCHAFRNVIVALGPFKRPGSNPPPPAGPKPAPPSNPPAARLEMTIRLAREHAVTVEQILEVLSGPDPDAVTRIRRAVNQIDGASYQGHAVTLRQIRNILDPDERIERC